MPTRLSLVTAVMCSMSAFAHAEVPVGGLESLRIPLSVRQATGLGAYVAPDPQAAFTNPALAGFQARTWETGAVNQLLEGANENLWGIAGGWAGPPGENGAVAATALISGFAIPSFQVVDGNDVVTGATVAPSTVGVGVAGAYQWHYISLGVAARFDSESYGLAGVSSITKPTFGAGAAMNFRSVTFGAALTGLGAYGPVVLDVGVGFRFGRVQLGLEMSNSALEMGNIAKTGPLFLMGLGGVITRNLEIHAGAGIPLAVGPDSSFQQLPSGFVSVRGGFTVHIRDWSFDYGLSLPMAGASDMSHLISVGRSFGPARDLYYTSTPESAAPRFSLDANGRTLAVATFEPQNVSSGDAAVIADLFRSEMIKQGVFQVVEKANMEKVLSEQAFQQSGCTTQECAVKLGKVLNVKFLVVGSFGKLLDRFVLNIRVVDVETARAVYSDSEQGKDVPEVQVGITRLATRLSAAVSATK